MKQNTMARTAAHIVLTLVIMLGFNTPQPRMVRAQDAPTPHLLKDITPGSPSSSIGGLTAVNGKLFFVVSPDDTHDELWVSDGTEQGTTIVNVQNDSPWHISIIAAANKVLFFEKYRYGPYENQIWRTDGTQEGSWDIGSFRMERETVFNDELYFLRLNTEGLYTIWKTNGEKGNLTYLHTVQTPTSPVIEGLCSELRGHGQRLFFGFHTPENAGCDLWSYDLVSNTSQKISSFGWPITYRSTYNNLLYFIAKPEVPPDPYTRRFEMLWQTDGTSGGTKAIVAPGDLPNHPRDAGAMVEYGRAFYFLGRDCYFYGCLWKLPFGSAKAEKIADLGWVPSYYDSEIHIVNNLMVFPGAEIGSHYSRSDGTTAGTHTLYPEDENLYYEIDTYNMDRAVFDGKLFFTEETTKTYYELWATDGNTIGMVMDINPGSAPSIPSNFTRAGFNLFFTADDGTHGRELWVYSVVKTTDLYLPAVVK